jgi:hypothetical protein
MLLGDAYFGQVLFEILTTSDIPDASTIPIAEGIRSG